ncbi:penicillin-binding protein activator [Alphaproteobacteria bacterium]|nr:penicillin-binding protein activator [Alphaproteobacteria bacterium]
MKNELINKISVYLLMLLQYLLTLKQQITKPLYTIVIILHMFFFSAVQAEQHKNIVGVLLPTTGQNEEIGNIVKKSVIMATYKFAPPNVVVRFYNTQSKKSGAIQAYSQALKDKAKIIVGPISSKNTNAIRSKQTYGIPILSLSNNTDSASSGVFTTGYSPQSQGAGIVRIIEYLKRERVIAIIPRNTFGSLFESGLSQAEWGTIKNVYYYDPDNYDYSKLVKTIVADREYYNYDAIILPDSNPKNIRILSSQLSYYDAFNLIEKEKDKKIFLIGGLGWDKIGETHKEPGLLNGYYLAHPKSKNRTKFNEEYKKLYGFIPPYIANLAYDITALAIISATTPNPQQKLMQEQGYKGISGTFKMSSYGNVERIYDIKKVFRDRTKKILQVKTNSR